MAKGQMRSNREQKKPKQTKKLAPGPVSPAGTQKITVPTTGKNR